MYCNNVNLVASSPGPTLLFNVSCRKAGGRPGMRSHVMEREGERRSNERGQEGL